MIFLSIKKATPMYLGGLVTQSQLISIIIAIVAIILVLSILKGLIRKILLVVILCIGLVSFGVLSPKQLKDIGNKVTAQTISKYETFAKVSKNIKIEKDTIYIKVGKDTWCNIKDIKSVVTSGKDVMTIIIKDKPYEITDTKVQELIKQFL